MGCLNEKKMVAIVPQICNRLCVMATTHPVYALLDHPLSASRKEGKKQKKFPPLYATQSERGVDERSDVGVSRPLVSLGPMFFAISRLCPTFIIYHHNTLLII